MCKCVCEDVSVCEYLGGCEHLRAVGECDICVLVCVHVNMCADGLEIVTGN